MSLSPRPAVGLAALAVLGALVGASPAAAGIETARYTCAYPLAGAAPVEIVAGFDEVTGELSFKVSSLTGDEGNDPSYEGYRLTRSATVTGSISARLQGYWDGDLRIDGRVTADLETTTVPSTPAPVVLTAKPTYIPGYLDPRRRGSYSPQAVLGAGDFSLNLRSFDKDGKPVTLWNGGVAFPTDSDGDPQSFDVPCTEVNGTGSGILYYRPRFTVTPTPTPTVTPTPTPAPPTPTPTPTPQTPTPTASGVKYSYGLSGKATLKTLTKGTLPLAGRADATLQLASGNFTAALSLNQTRGNLVALGFLPVVADVALVPQGDATGQLTDAGLSVNTKVRIKLPKVTLFGLQLAGGANCQAKNPSDIKLASPGEFSPLDGGTIAGTFTISDLTGCGGLTGLVSPLTAGKGNAIALALTPLVKPVPAPTTTGTPTPVPRSK